MKYFTKTKDSAKIRDKILKRSNEMKRKTTIKAQRQMKYNPVALVS
jgi:hypothetical protein